MKVWVNAKISFPSIRGQKRLASVNEQFAACLKWICVALVVWRGAEEMQRMIIEAIKVAKQTR
jgi:hypothetical protein